MDGLPGIGYERDARETNVAIDIRYDILTTSVAAGKYVIIAKGDILNTHNNPFANNSRSAACEIVAVAGLISYSLDSAYEPNLGGGATLRFSLLAAYDFNGGSNGGQVVLGCTTSDTDRLVFLQNAQLVAMRVND